MNNKSIENRIKNALNVDMPPKSVMNGALSEMQSQNTSVKASEKANECRLFKWKKLAAVMSCAVILIALIPVILLTAGVFSGGAIISDDVFNIVEIESIENYYIDNAENFENELLYFDYDIVSSKLYVTDSQAAFLQENYTTADIEITLYVMLIDIDVEYIDFLNGFGTLESEESISNTQIKYNYDENEQILNALFVYGGITYMVEMHGQDFSQSLNELSQIF